MLLQRCAYALVRYRHKTHWHSCVLAYQTEKHKASLRSVVSSQGITGLFCLGAVLTVIGPP